MRFRPLFFCIPLLYGLGTLLYTYPLATDLNRPFSAVGDYLAITYGLSWQLHALLHEPAAFFQANIMYPAANALAIATPLNTAQLVFFAPGLALTGDPVQAINWVHLGTIYCSAVSVYWVLRRHGARRSAAFVGGWIFAFAIGKINQGFQFPCFWMVWTFHFWHCFLQERQMRSLLAAALAFVVAGLGSFYLMYMTFFGLVAWTLGFHFRVRSLLERRLVAAVLGAAVLAGLVLLPFGLPYFEVSKTYGLKRPMGETIQYSADPLGTYLLPNNRSLLYDAVRPGVDYWPLPGEEALFAAVSGGVRRLAGTSVLGGWQGELGYRDFHGIWAAGAEERRTFFGYSVLLLVALGLGARLPAAARSGRFLAAVLLFSSIALSLGPVLVVLGHLTYLPGPYALFYFLVPGLKGLRAVARYSYMAMLAASLLSACGWWVLQRTLERKTAPKNRRWVAGGALLLWLVFFTLENLPAKRVLHEPLPEPAAVYTWLRDQPIDGGIVEIPTFKGAMNKKDPVYGARRVEYSHREYLYMFYSTVHWKPIFNGFGSFISPLQFEVRDAVERLPERAAVDFLKGLGLRTFVLHRNLFEEEDRVFWGRRDVLDVLERVAEVDSALVYRLR